MVSLALCILSTLFVIGVLYAAGIFIATLIRALCKIERLSAEKAIERQRKAYGY